MDSIEPFALCRVCIRNSALLLVSWFDLVSPLTRTNIKFKETHIYIYTQFSQNYKYVLEILHKKSSSIYWLNIVGASLLSGQQLHLSLLLYVPSPMRYWTEVSFYLKKSLELGSFSLKIGIVWSFISCFFNLKCFFV